MVSFFFLVPLLAYPSAAATPPMMRRSADVSPQGAQHMSRVSEPQASSKASAPPGSLLEVADVERIMEHAGVHKKDFDIKKFDQNGDGHLSADELRALAPTANAKGVPNKLVDLMSRKAEEDGRSKDDINWFNAADANSNSLLEAGEVDALLAKTPLPPGSFNWRKYDFDGDGALSRGEFLAAGSAVFDEVQQHRQAELEQADILAHEQQQASLLEEESANAETQDAHIFRLADTNQNGFLEESEMDELNNRAGLSGFKWKIFDEDKDNRLSPAEFVKSGPAASQFGEARRMEQLLQEVSTRTKEGDDEDRKVFKKADTDGSSFLEENEIDALLKKTNVGLPFDWRKFDHDHDGRLNETEFLEGGPAAIEAALLQEDDMDVERKDDYEVWKVTDKDQNGFIEANEIEKLLHEADIKDFDWKAYDFNKDGRLDPQEFGQAAGEMKAKASVEFRQHIQKLIGEENTEK